MLKDKIVKYVGLLVTFRVEECIQELLRDSIGVGIECAIDYNAFQEKMEEYIQRHDNRANKEQLEDLLNDIGQDVYESIRNHEIDVIGKVENLLTEEFKQRQINPDICRVLKADLMCQILLYIKNRDVLFYNQLIERKENQQNIDAIKKRLLQLERMLSVYLKHKDSPLKEIDKYLHIDNVDNIDIRAREIEGIRRRFREGSNVLFLYGRPGIGKTTLARLYARECSEQGEQIFFEKYENSIEYTVGKLAKKPSKNSGKEILNYWRGVEASVRKKVLLIIDNFNEDTLQGSNKGHFNRELEGDFYKQFIDLGVKVLFTTRINVDNNVYVVKPVEEIFELFVRYSGITTEAAKENEKLIEEVISMVKGNTLLLVLVAHIWNRIDERGKYELINRLNDCRLAEQVEETTVDADIDAVEDMTIYEQASAILDFSGILSDTEVHKVFAKAVLLPNEGMSKFEFKKMANCKDDNSLYKLVRNSWILNEFDNISVHPVIREIAFRKNLVTYELCYEYCRSVNSEIRIDLPFEKRFVYKKYAEEIYRRFACNKDLDEILVNLFYRLSAIYDALAESKKSLQVINRISLDIKNVIEKPIDKARMLSGIAFSLNNCFDNMETLEQAKQLLDEAMKIVDVADEESCKLKYAQTYGRILSNYGSNSLAKSKCNQDAKIMYLKVALKRHKDALAYRESKWDCFENDAKARQIINGEIATSYTTIATDYYYMEQYDKAISYHQRAYEIRDSLLLEKEKNINCQRIVGCIIAWYKKSLEVHDKYIELALSYYPSLLHSNYEVGAMNNMKDNLCCFIELVSIITNDKRFDGFVKEMEEKKADILKWMKAENVLLEPSQMEINQMKGYEKQEE